jgi:hypothetical protein
VATVVTLSVFLFIKKYVIIYPFHAKERQEFQKLSPGKAEAISFWNYFFEINKLYVVKAL